ncbi:MAG: hypothetical protein IKB88_02800 [Clostridia bacterium]|nr:hypothetical protein [Clostridia bacterium]
MKAGKRLFNILLIAVAVIIVVYFAAELYGFVAHSYTTQTVFSQTVPETVDAQMYIIRDETILTNAESGVTVQIADNGERISRGSSIAAVFGDEASAENYVEAEALKKKLEVYKSIDSQLKLANIDMDKLSAEINSEFMSIINDAYNNDYESLEKCKLAFSEKLSRRQISLEQTVDCSEKISTLTSKINSLESSAKVRSVITAETSGYFVGTVDGYENVLTAESVDSLTPEILSQAFAAKKADVPDNAIGKIINGYNWYIATVIDSAKTVGYTKGKTVKLILGEGNDLTVTTSVYSTQVIKGNKTLVVFRCNLMSDELASLRKVDGKVVINEYTGLKVTKDAVRFDSEGKPGVFIRRGNIINFRSLNIIYNEEKYVIAFYDREKDKDIKLNYDHLELYDEIIISGKDLEDGMVI